VRRDAAAIAGLLAAGALLSAAVVRQRGAEPRIQDEFAYLFQAKLIAGGHLSAPPPALPEFFEAAHILVEPRFTAKYLPGHALLLAPFEAAGVPWVWPYLSLCLAAVALFAALRFAGAGTAWAAAGGALLLCSPEALKTWSTLLSHATSSLCVAVAIACASRWARTRSAWWAAALGAAGAYAVWTRPFVGVALCAAAVVLVAWGRDARSLLALGAALGAGALVVVLTCKAVTGHPLQTPWSLYAQQYTPFDGPGLGAPDPAAPLRRLPPHLQPLADGFRESRALHTAARLPAVAQRRLGQIAELSPGILLLAFAPLALAAGPAALFAAGFAALFFALQLSFHFNSAAHLVEAWPALAFLVAAGAWKTARLAAARGPAVRIALASALGLAAVHAATMLVEERAGLTALAAGSDPVLDRVERLLEPARRERGLVFLRYPPHWNPNVDATYNEPDLERAPLVRALDLGERNRELRALFPARPAFLLDLGSGELQRLDPLTSRAR
jgi:hypothetical protein